MLKKTNGSKRGISYFLALVMAIILTITLGTIIFASSTNLLGTWNVNKQIQLTGTYKIGKSLKINIKNVGNVKTTISNLTVFDLTINSTVYEYNAPIVLEPGQVRVIEVPATNVNIGDYLELIVSLEDGSIRVFRCPVQ